MKQNGRNKKVWIGAIVLVALVAVFGIINAVNRPKAQEGTKAYTLSVVDKEGAEKTYSGKTDAEYLRGLMDELAAAGDFSYEGDDGEYGLYINTVNGVTANYEADASYWSIYVNGEMGMYGADSQVVNDGDNFRLVYEVYAGE